MRLRSKEISVFNMSALDLFASALGAFILITLVLFPYFPNTGDSQERVDEVKAQLAQANTELEETSVELEQTSAELEQTSAELEEVRAQLNPALEQELQAVRGQLGSCETERQEAQAALNSCQAEQRQAASMDSALGACENRNQRMQQELQSCEQQLRKKFVLVVISWSTGDDVDLHVIDPSGREYYFGKKFHSGSRAKLEEDNTRGPGNEIWLHPAAEPGRYRVYFKYYSGSGRNVRVRGAVLTPRGRTELPGTVLRRVGEKPWVATINVDDEGNADVVAR